MLPIQIVKPTEPLWNPHTLAHRVEEGKRGLSPSSLKITLPAALNAALSYAEIIIINCSKHELITSETHTEPPKTQTETTPPNPKNF